MGLAGSRRAAAALTLGALLAAACSTPVRQSYVAAPGPALRPYSGTTAIYGSADPEGDGRNLVRDGYARLGTSRFRTDGHVTFDELKSEGQTRGADVVLFSSRRPGRIRYLPPESALRENGGPHALAPYTHVSSAGLAGGNYGGSTTVGGGTMDFRGTVTSSGIPGVSAEDMAAINAQDFDYEVSFWRKAAQP